MSIILPALAVAFAAFCVWLAVRIINRRKRPGWKFWTSIALAALVLYPLSCVPLSLVAMKTDAPDWIAIPASLIYMPLGWMNLHGPEWWKRCNTAYFDWWWSVIFPEYEEQTE